MNKKRLLLFLIVFTVIFTGTVLSALKVLECSQLRGRIQITAEEIKRVNLTSNAINEENAGLENTLRELQDLEKMLTRGAAQGEVLVNIADTAGDYGITVVNLEPQRAIANQYYRVLPVLLTLKGDYKDLVCFLKDVEEGQAAGSFARVETLSISAYPKKGVDFNKGAVLADFLINVYFHLPAENT